MRLVISRDAAADFVADLVRIVPDRLCQAILFGSVAKGVETPDSDLDVLLVVDRKDAGVKETIYALVLDYAMNRDVPISAKVYARPEFERLRAMHTPFMQEIERTGVILWTRS